MKSVPLPLAGTKRWNLYRLYDAGDALLYIGITTDPQRRWKEHRKEMPWWPEVVRKDVEILAEDVEFPAALEHEAIRAENPRYNKVGFGFDKDGEPLGPRLPTGVPPQPHGTRIAYQFRELRPMYRQAWFLWRLLLQDGLETQREQGSEQLRCDCQCLGGQCQAPNYRGVLS
ncbi:GIY-YIG nuclease family protein [Streptomyces vilmorinianum]|uniref:GIY-YIG nuclease family protein n=1 Tax=Streptomyces vilmorinianum TaxID=3051092 RepID=UPI0010FB1C7D|nr:GIY-YIG nuclease family protein [Streptomyces vilmorinianum]